MARQYRALRYPQRGIALFIVMVLVLLTSLLVLWATRSALLNEMVTGNDADYQRAFEAAQAMLRDAELDIMGVRANGTTTIPRCGETGASASCRPAALPANIVVTGNAPTLYFPSSYSLDDDDGGDLVVLEGLMPRFKEFPNGGCLAAICTGGVTRIDNPGGTENTFWANADLLEEMKASAASYGQYTGAQIGDEDKNGANPLLRDSAWYWVEPLLYEASLSADAASRFAPRGGGTGNTTGIVYRITAYAEGRKPGTRIVLQNIFVKQAVAPADS
ncbi:pilus assembly protein [Corticibacter populi]|uniref:Pilus assembly protein n=2 Tax=Corticibacter populi TaxID=1550736 RepID=A0A3M6QPN4_9BURK|nr:pilus assembly protein [Corticibacter populi]